MQIMDGRSRIIQNSILTQLNEIPGGFIAQCKICEKCFDRLVASVTADSVLFVALPPEEALKNGREPCLIAISLPHPVYANRTRVEYERSDLLLTLEKREGVGA